MLEKIDDLKYQLQTLQLQLNLFAMKKNKSTSDISDYFNIYQKLIEIENEYKNLTNQ